MEAKNKVRMQENLKKAFMRGVCALNLEAMSALNPGMPNMDPFAMDFEMPGPVADPSLNKSPAPLPAAAPIESQMEPHPMSMTTMMINEQKIESKDHMWKPAPILSKEFATTVIRPMTQQTPIMQPMQNQTISNFGAKIDGRSAMVLEKTMPGNIGNMGEQEIKCERVQNDAMNNGIEGENIENIETRSFSSTKQTININQPLETPSTQPEGKVIRVNKYGKSYAEFSNKMPETQPKKPVKAIDKKKPLTSHKK